MSVAALGTRTYVSRLCAVSSKLLVEIDCHRRITPVVLSTQQRSQHSFMGF